jgi:hypothetical protein
MRSSWRGLEALCCAISFSVIATKYKSLAKIAKIAKGPQRKTTGAKPIAGGFRLWWRALTGSDDTPENTHLMRLAGRFSRRIRGYAKVNRIPVVGCSAGERKHELAQRIPG